MSAESTAQQAALTQAAAQLQALAPADLLALFGPGISQQARLITLETAQGSGLPDSLVADRFWGTRVRQFTAKKSVETQ